MQISKATPQKFGIVASVAAYVLGFLYIQFAHFANHQSYVALYDSFQTVAPLCAGIFGIHYALKMQHSTWQRKAGWMSLGLGALSWGLGQAAWTYYELFVGQDAPFPGPPDIGFFLCYPFLIAGVFLLFGSIPKEGRFRLVFDSIVTVSGVAILSWYFILQHLWTASDVSPLAKFLGMCYPCGDLIVLFGAMVLISGSYGDKGLRESVAFLTGGIIMIAAADAGYAFYTLNQTYHTGMWTDSFWSFGWLLFGGAFAVPLYWRQYSAWDRSEEQIEPIDALKKFRKIVAPYAIAAIATLLVFLHDYIGDGIISVSTVASGYVVMLIVLLRQVATLSENRRLYLDLQNQLNENEILTSRLRLFNEGLEQKVARRTEQINSLHQLTREVSSVHDTDAVVKAATANTRRALGSYGALLWLDHGSAHSFQLAGEVGIGGESALLHELELQAGRGALKGHTSRSVTVENATLLMAPLLWRDRMIGAIGAVNLRDPFDAADVAMIEAIGVEVGAALARAKQYEEALRAADHDSVTGLLNHRVLQQKLKQAFATGQKRTEPLAVVLMDLNNFRLFNETYGHSVGDVILESAAKVLVQEADSATTVGRYGGDEFLIIMPGSMSAHAIDFAERVQARLALEGFVKPGEDRTIPISVTFGVAAMPEDTSDRHELLSTADRNLHTAKLNAERIATTTFSQRSNRELREEATFSILDAIVTAVDNKDRYTRHHSEDVTDYALWIAEELELGDATKKSLRAGSLLHDVGKIGIPADILAKPGRLTEDEYATMKGHPHLGWLIVKSIPDTEDILDAIRSHHERWDGAGYPDGLKGEEIPLMGRILAIADAFSAMTTDRPYRKGMDWERACEEIRSHSGTQFDPDLAATFLRAIERRIASKASAESDALKQAA